MNTKQKRSLTSAALDAVAITVLHPILKRITLGEQLDLVPQKVVAGKIEYEKLPGPPPRCRRRDDWD